MEDKNIVEIIIWVVLIFVGIIIDAVRKSRKKAQSSRIIFKPQEDTDSEYFPPLLDKEENKLPKIILANNKVKKAKSSVALPKTKKIVGTLNKQPQVQLPEEGQRVTHAPRPILNASPLEEAQSKKERKEKLLHTLIMGEILAPKF